MACQSDVTPASVGEQRHTAAWSRTTPSTDDCMLDTCELQCRAVLFTHTLSFITVSIQRVNCVLFIAYCVDTTKIDDIDNFVDM